MGLSFTNVRLLLLLLLSVLIEPCDALLRRILWLKSLRSMPINRYPFTNSLTIFEVSVVNVVESFIVGIQPPFFQLYKFSAEAAPELNLSIPSYPASLDLILYVLIVDLLMVLFKMLHEQFSAIEESGALGIRILEV